MKEKIVEAVHLTKYFGKFCAVCRVNFEIGKREIFGFLGPNGAGKTTIMRMINCFFPPSDGELYVDGLDVRVEKRKIKKILGVVHQDINLDFDFSIEKNLLVYSRYYNIPRRKARERTEYLLHLFKLFERKNDVVEHLSYGQKKRMILARALINSPKILLLDEPTTGLDPQARYLIWEKIRTFKEEGLTVILTTHYMEEAHELCDRVAIMDKGEILDIESPNQLIEKYAKRKIGRRGKRKIPNLEDVFFRLTGGEG
jgi:lipooligosaccharide transport system ATP-binding protein